MDFSMKILNLGIDNSVLDKNSKLAKRAVAYGGLVEKYIIIVPFAEGKIVDLSEKVKVFGVKTKNKVFGFIKIYNLAKRLMKKEKINLISVQDQYYLGFMSLRLAKKFKIGLEIQVHGFEKYGGLRKVIAKYILPRANAVRCVSLRLKKELISEFRVKENNITVAQIFVDIAKMSLRGAFATKQSRQDALTGIALPSTYNGKVVFLTIGRLVPVKNIVIQIKAMVEVIKKFPEVELWIIGEGPEKNNLEYIINNLELSEKVKLLGWQGDLRKFYSQADVFMLTSNYEGWGLAVIEAAAYGLPIIMTDVGCAGEVIRNRENGIIISVGDVKKLGEAMVKIMENKDLRKKLGDSACEAVKKLPNKNETLALYKKSWEKALK
ncbi:hypothetical protein CO115_02550 [Candidatus Falkowbacteria bacterium CG_4_9_14_3_um_filter_36_9]|uniref:Glycosyl transferase family 1 domain-containing protein n=2 Tax=Candidatus Falkowiibacteriota TaxID=1752728 RepID=A0A2M7DLT6_9BACT|nr:MAG: hypothetical protein COS18_03885 [Candidatus Falkowbacteria bacterium CG02_land_8_20_14_3_00_36_14]PIX11188.1 MAG: hypothetical protein COZ73_03310 [Candidatus Falkowbacteria bacterium CG_4_8_14_3_um_filter_36_11]PJA11335.1 MAG: hypothetical protein COX67_00475 [Candidatus Falkowbacteria bacterium CG_4_10_14_0_2_um_filter_36_22]PJB19601.1 MAG: hypothetical protein CO115_02550 [Candidatus Falkowbacteria bacterium CG_4_9_14_3_um_filter_36_9]